MNFTSNKPHFEYLRKKWNAKSRNLESSLWDKHGKHLRQLALGSLGGLLLLTTPAKAIVPTNNLPLSRDDIVKDYDRNILLAARLKDKTPDETRPLSLQEETQITDILSGAFGFKATGELNGIRLNRNFGLIGGEQHLYRYPGDNLYAHADTSSEWAMFGEAGIAPGLGAWGYFAPSKGQFGEVDKLREKYYLAIQTFLVSGYAEDPKKFNDFFKYKKMLVVNPKTGQAVVAVIADVGPSEWTGKHLGGSPEVMEALGLATGPRKGEVMYFFIDDPKDKIPLGSVKAKEKE